MDRDLALPALERFTAAAARLPDDPAAMSPEQYQLATELLRLVIRRIHVDADGIRAADIELEIGGDLASQQAAYPSRAKTG